LNNTITSLVNAITLRTSSNQATVSGNNISHSQTGISVTSHGTVTDSFISNCNVGISIAYYANPTFERNLITDNTLGVRLYRSALLAQGMPQVRNNTITNNSVGFSIESFSFPNYVVAANFEYNNIYDNSYNLNSTVSNSIDATNNWWGTTDIKSINQTINDVTLDFTGCTVIFIPFLTEPNLEAAPLENTEIPEFPSWIVLPLFITATFVVIVVRRKLVVNF
jgi:hypothetical protein